MVTGWRAAVVVGVLGLVAASGLAVGAGAEAAAETDGTEPPLADAGLDQTVANGSTVYLDAGGSVDPDGTITATEWTIRGPNNTTVAPSCTRCVRPAFTPAQTGEYRATVTVTGSDGATSTDTLYVTVEPPAGPTVNLTGPTTAAVDTPTAYTVTARADAADLQRLVWFRNGSRARTVNLSGETANLTVMRRFTTSGTYRLRASVLDGGGHARGAGLTVTVTAGGGGSGGGGGGGGLVRCPNGGHPVFSDEHDVQTGCRKEAARSLNGTLIPLSTGEREGLDNPDMNRWTDPTTGVQYMLSADRVDELERQNDGRIRISQMKKYGEKKTEKRGDQQHGAHDHPANTDDSNEQPSGGWRIDPRSGHDDGSSGDSSEGSVSDQSDVSNGSSDAYPGGPGINPRSGFH